MKPWLYLPSKWAHELSPFFLPLISLKYPNSVPEWNAKSWQGLKFHNPMGIAGGVDKNGDLLPSWIRLGSGFIEIGTVTPEPQSPNPGKIMDRNIAEQAIWNKMGFPSIGAKAVHEKVQKHLQWCRQSQVPLFINIGKNRTTPNELASQDYIELMDVFADQADAFVVNISSPNTSGLRDLLKPLNLQNFLKPICDKRNQLRPPISNSTSASSVPQFSDSIPQTQAPSPMKQTPILLKLSPDMEDESLYSALDTAAACGVNGFILTNTTLDRPPGIHFPTEGGMSGKPLSEKSKQILNKTLRHLGNDKKDLLIVSAGGIMTPNDVLERLNLGADLVQIYSALIYHGPSIFRDTARKAHQQK